MSEKTQNQNQISQTAQMLFNKGFSAFERGNLDIAIDLLLRCVAEAPGFLRARRFLRISQIQRMTRQNKGSLLRNLADAAGIPIVLQARVHLQKKNGADALIAAEKLLSINPVNRQFVDIFTQAALLGEQPEAAVMTLELAVEARPNDIDLVRSLGDIYMEVGNFGKARDCYSKFVDARPTDPDGLKLLKDAEARHSMQSGGWDESTGKEGGYKDLIKDSAQAASLDMQAKAVISGNDFETLVAEARAKILAEPKNLNYYRALARLFSQQKRFREAVEVFEEARAINPADPELDRNLAQTRIQLYMADADALRSQGDLAAAAELEHECKQFVFDDLVARVERYPNDPRLRFELGLQYFENDHFDDAIQQFQLAQRSPKERTDALYYLARCFRAKGQLDMATMQLEVASELLPVIDDNRKKVLFELGEVHEQLGKMEDAFACYKEIYSADIGYRDVGQKMERFYKSRQGKN